MPKLKIQNYKIISNRNIQHRYYKIIIKAPKISRYVEPGQFLQIKINNGYEPLLRRPFSVHRSEGSNTEILYEVVGKGTEILSQKKSGEYLDVIGPLGNGFSYPLSAKRYTLSILAAGGMGIAPLLFLAERLIKRSTLHAPRSTLILIGAEAKNKILCERDFMKLGYKVKIATDDGSRGFKGKATDLLKSLLSAIGYRPSAIYACGPRPMLKEIDRISRIHRIPAQISLEEHLACGIGACLCCAVNTRQGFKRVCKDGPVFKAQEIIW